MAGERLAGSATVDGTARGCESFGSLARVLGRTGLHVSPIGFGCYRVRIDSAVHRQALAEALRVGVNLIDTSTNYGDGASEKLVGLILANMVQRGEIRRDQVVVISKVGYVQGRNLQRARARRPSYPDIVEVSDDCWHCIHPDFIRDQLEVSLDRLGLARLDGFLLHNPEYFLTNRVHRGDSIDADSRAEFDRRISLAFEALEEAVASGSIGWYGVSSNTFVDAPDSPTSSSLSRMIELARGVADDHHFAVAQMPMNLYELGAVTWRHHTAQGDRTVLEIADAADIGVLANRPLNAIVRRGEGEQLVRLADPGAYDALDQSAQNALRNVRKLEAQWATGLGRRLVTDDGGDNAIDLFRWGQELSSGLHWVRDVHRWRRLRNEVIAPQLGETSAALLASLEGEAKGAFSDWWEAYGRAMHAVFEAVEASLSSHRVPLAREANQRLAARIPKEWDRLRLSQKSVLTLLGAPLCCVLVGMRQPSYVHDLLAAKEHMGVGQKIDFAGLAAEFAQ